MRIALFTDTYAPQVNGVARTLGRLVRHAQARCHELAVVAPAPCAPAEHDTAAAFALPSIAVPFYPELRLARPLDRWSARRLAEFAPDVIHLATEFTVGWSGLQFAATHRVPLLSSFHTDFPAYLAGYGLAGFERAAWRYLRSFHARAAVTLCPSHATRDQLRANGFEHPLRIWSRGVDADLFSPARRRAEVRAAIAPDAHRILLYVGRLAPEKRLDVLLDAFARLSASRRGLALVVVGDGPAAAALRKRAAPGVHFLGYRSGEALAEIYAAADLFTFASDTETFGNVVLEALASGLPVVTVCAGGVQDSVIQGETGILVEPGNPVAMADACAALLDCDAERARLAAGARRYARARGWDAILDGVLDTYAEVAARRLRIAA